MASHPEEKGSCPPEVKIQKSSGSDEKEQQAEGSTTKKVTKTSNDGAEMFSQQPSTNAQTSKRKRTTEGKKIYFKLFKIQNGNEKYILKLHDQITFAVVTSYYIKLENKDGEKWNVGINKLDEQTKPSVDMMEEDVDPPIFHKRYNLPLSERLSGWTLENRKRERGVVDKFYYHQNRQFRSLVEVAVFLLYSSKPKDLKPLTTIVNVPESLEEDVATALILLSKGEAYDSHAQRPVMEQRRSMRTRSLGKTK